MDEALHHTGFEEGMWHYQFGPARTIHYLKLWNILVKDTHTTTVSYAFKQKDKNLTEQTIMKID